MPESISTGPSLVPTSLAAIRLLAYAHIVSCPDTLSLPSCHTHIGETLDGTLSSWNRGAEQIYGYTPADILGKPNAILAPPELRYEIP